MLESAECAGSVRVTRQQALPEGLQGCRWVLGLAVLWRNECVDQRLNLLALDLFCTFGRRLLVCLIQQEISDGGEELLVQGRGWSVGCLKRRLIEGRQLDRQERIGGGSSSWA